MNWPSGSTMDKKWASDGSLYRQSERQAFRWRSNVNNDVPRSTRVIPVCNPIGYAGPQHEPHDHLLAKRVLHSGRVASEFAARMQALSPDARSIRQDDLRAQARGPHRTSHAPRQAH